MRKFLNSQKHKVLSQRLKIYNNEFANFIENERAADDRVLNVHATNMDEYLLHVSLTHGNVLQGFLHYDTKLVKLIGPSSSDTLVEPEISWLSTALDIYLSCEDARLVQSSVTGAFQRYASVSVHGQIFGSEESRLDRSSYIIASWCDNNGAIRLDFDPRPGRVLYYMELYVKMSNDQSLHLVLARVHWYQTHPSKNMFGNDKFQVWVQDLYELPGPASFMPVQRIKTKFMSGFIKTHGEDVRVVIPRTEHVFW